MDGLKILRDLQNLALKVFFLINLRLFWREDNEICLFLSVPPFDFKEDDEHQRISLWSLLQIWQTATRQKSPIASTEDRMLSKLDK